MKPEETTDYTQPVAYDHQGRPLYAHPPAAPATMPTTQQAPAVVQMIRPIEPPKQEMSPETRRRHDESKRQFPQLNLSEGEYVIKAVRRHVIGLVIPMTIGVLLIAFALAILINFETIASEFNMRGPMADGGSMAIPLSLFIVIVALAMFAVYYVYVNNKFFLTNESVIQEIQLTIFARKEQTVSLANIEDASYTQHGMLQLMFNFGSIRLSTEGDETTYRFTYVTNPKEHIAALNNAVEAFKLGRPVDQ